MREIDQIKVVVFDADDTLFRVKGGVETVYSRILEKYGRTSPLDKTKRALQESWLETVESYYRVDDRYRATHERDRSVWKLFTKKVVDRLGGVLEFEQFFEEVYWFFSTAESRDVNPKAVQLLKTVRTMGLQTGVLTNNDRRIHPLLESLQIRSLFDQVFCASDVGYRKPSRDSFEETRSRFKVEAQHCLYIGDSLDDDFHGAKNAGWHALLLRTVRTDRLLQEADPKRTEAVKILECFSELEASFERMRELKSGEVAKD